MPSAAAASRRESAPAAHPPRPGTRAPRRRGLARLAPLALAALLAGCEGSSHAVDEGGDDPASVTWSWKVERAAELGEKIGCVVFGDFDPLQPGDELAALGVSGRVWLLVPRAGGWDAREIARAPGEMIQGVAADLDPTVAGDELVMVGMAEGREESGGPGAAFAAVRTADGPWELVSLHETASLIHGVTAAELIPVAPGPEVVLTGFDRNVVLLNRSVDGAFTTRELTTLQGAGKHAAPHGDGVVVAVTDGRLTYVQPSLDDAEVSVLAEYEAPLARLGSDGERVLVACDDGALLLVSADGDAQVIHRERQKLRGAVLANLDPVSTGLEAACVGYEGDLVVLRRDPGAGWQPEVVLHDDDRLHHLAVGEPAARTDGLALATGGYSGTVWVAWREMQRVDPEAR